MKVLLCEDVKSVGWLGDIVEVNDGYARNYLLPQGLAKAANKTNVRAIANEKAKRAEQRIDDRKRMEEAAKKVEGAEAVLAAKANEQGILFGSITAGAIAENLRAQGFEVADAVVQLPEHIKQVGTHSITLKFDNELTAKVSVVVVPEGGVPGTPTGDVTPASTEHQPPKGPASTQQGEQDEPASDGDEEKDVLDGPGDEVG